MESSHGWLLHQNRSHLVNEGCDCSLRQWLWGQGMTGTCWREVGIVLMESSHGWLLHQNLWGHTASNSVSISEGSCAQRYPCCNLFPTDLVYFGFGCARCAYSPVGHHHFVLQTDMQCWKWDCPDHFVENMWTVHFQGTERCLTLMMICPPHTVSGCPECLCLFDWIVWTSSFSCGFVRHLWCAWLCFRFFLFPWLSQFGLFLSFLSFVLPLLHDSKKLNVDALLLMLASYLLLWGPSWELTAVLFCQQHQISFVCDKFLFYLVKTGYALIFSVLASAGCMQLQGTKKITFSSCFLPWKILYCHRLIYVWKAWARPTHLQRDKSVCLPDLDFQVQWSQI